MYQDFIYENQYSESYSRDFPITYILFTKLHTNERRWVRPYLSRTTLDGDEDERVCSSLFHVISS